MKQMLNSNSSAGTAADSSTQPIVLPSASLAQNTMLSASLSVRDANYLMAEFMGYEDFKQTGAVIKGDSMKFVLCYDSIWSEIMPVVEKIESLSEEEDFEVAINKYTVSIHGKSIPKLTHLSPTHTSIFYLVGEDEPETKKIKCLFDCIVDFILWYNQHTAALGSS